MLRVRFNDKVAGRTKLDKTQGMTRLLCVVLKVTSYILIITFIAKTVRTQQPINPRQQPASPIHNMT